MKLSTCLFVIICVENTSGFSPDSTCGVSKGCFKSYECGSGDCTYLVTWYRSGDQMKFSFTSTVTGSSKYLCLGFSGDSSMGDDSTIACKYVSGSVSVEGGYNVGESYTILSNPLEKISNVVVSATDATFTCTFDRQINSTNSKIFDLNTKWYLFIAEGFITDGVLQEHYASHPPKSEAVVDLFAFEVIIGGLMNEKTAKVHGLLMVLTWMVFSSVGLVIARYFKSEWSNKTILGQKVWFQVHRACMVSVLILTVLSFFVIILSAGGYRDNLEASDKKHLNFHPVLGIVILILTCINPIMSFFRCSPDDSRRKYFNWAHFCVGVSAHILAVINMIFGLQLTKAGVKIGAAYVMYVYIAVYILFEVFFEILKWSEQSQVEDNRSDMNMITPEAEDTTKSQPNTDTNQKVVVSDGKDYLRYHPILGIVVMALTVINPIMSLFRCAPTDKKRPLFNIAHFIVGTGAYLLAAITILFGLNIGRLNIPTDASYVMYAYMAVFVFIEIAFQLQAIFEKSLNSSTDVAIEMKNENDKNDKGIQFEKRPVIRKEVFLYFHILLMVAFGVSMVVIVMAAD